MTEVRYFRMFSYEFQHLGQEREDSARGWGVFMCARFEPLRRLSVPNHVRYLIAEVLGRVNKTY